MASTSNIQIFNAPLFATAFGTFRKYAESGDLYDTMHTLSLFALKSSDDTARQTRICQFVSKEDFVPVDGTDIFTAITSDVKSFNIVNKLNERYKSVISEFDERESNEMSSSVYYIAAVPFNGVMSNLKLEPVGDVDAKLTFYNADFVKCEPFTYAVKGGKPVINYTKIAYFIIKAENALPLFDIKFSYTCTSCRYSEDGSSADITKRDFVITIETDTKSTDEFGPRVVRTTRETVELEAGEKVNLPRFSELFEKPVDATIHYKNTFKGKNNKGDFNNNKKSFDKNDRKPYNKNNGGYKKNDYRGGKNNGFKSYDKKPRESTFSFNPDEARVNKRLAAAKKRYGDE